MFFLKFFILSLMLFVTVGANDPILLQSPSVKCVTKGHTAQLQCTMKNATVKDTEVHWYLEQPGNNTKLVLTHDTRNITQRSSGFTERFQSSRDTNSNSFILTITNMQPSDSGNYFCEMWGDISGNGIQLTVTGSNPAVLLQSQSLESVTKGQTAHLQCTMRNAAVTQTEVSWVREQAGNSMDWALIHDVMNMTHRILGFPERFQSSRDSSSNSFILTITNVQPNDTGVYHCEVCGNISGTGIQLCVTEITHLWKTKLLWFILGALFGITGLILFIGYTCLRKKQSSTSQSGAADDPDTTAGYENVRTPQNSQDFPEDSNATYTTLQPMDRSIYSNLKETDKK
ncbi:immunoglobulin kappa light chain-like isoform X2 [Chiloscyllium punctatum]|uniref:immunoglobulin kappa light chain-like isoform X2 n=1 Tax=Chiloscyllium punctatum TaxID=137246 RepID=UPI003B637732